MDEGHLYVTGRLKDMIIIRGLNYYPHDLEYSLQNIHPDLRTNCCAIFAVEKEDKELLIIVQEVKKEDNPDLEEITSLIRNAILKEHYISPDVIILADRKTVPKTTSGKIQRTLCKQTGPTHEKIIL